MQVYTAEQIKDEVSNAVCNDLWDITGKEIVYEGDTTFRFDISHSNATILKSELAAGFTRLVTVYGEDVALYCLCRFDGDWLTVFVDTMFAD